MPLYGHDAYNRIRDDPADAGARYQIFETDDCRSSFESSGENPGLLACLLSNFGE